MKTPMAVFAVRLSENQVTWLDAHAEETKLTRSDVIRLLIDDAMDKELEEVAS